MSDANPCTLAMSPLVTHPDDDGGRGGRQGVVVGGLRPLPTRSIEPPPTDRAGPGPSGRAGPKVGESQGVGIGPAGGWPQAKRRFQRRHRESCLREIWSPLRGAQGLAGSPNLPKIAVSGADRRRSARDRGGRGRGFQRRLPLVEGTPACRPDPVRNRNHESGWGLTGRSWENTRRTATALRARLSAR